MFEHSQTVGYGVMFYAIPVLLAPITAGVFAIQALGAAVLPHLGRSLAWAAVCVTAFGLGFGVATIARPASVADRYGTRRYATIADTMTVPVTLAPGGAPVAGAALGTTRFLSGAAACCLVAAALLLVVARSGRRRAEEHLPQ